MFSYPPGREPTRSQWSPSEDIHDQALRGWSPSPGKLQKLLQLPEYSVFRGAQTFESNFFQVTKEGQFINIHKHPNVVTIGILASSPKLLLPDLMIIAREKQETTNKTPRSRALEITRLIPLELVEIFVHDASKRQLKMQLPTGDKYYLQLSAREEKADFLFECWVRLVYLIRLATGKSKIPENLPGKKLERPPSREHLQHSGPKAKKPSVDKESAKIQPKLQERFSPKRTSEGFTSRAPELISAADRLKGVREANFEKKKRLSSKISSESNPIPITLQKSKKEICLVQKTKMASPLQKSPQAMRNEHPATTSREGNPGPSKSPGPPSQSQSPKQNQPASRVEPRANSTLVETGPSQAVQRKSKVESEKESIPVNHLANQSQNSKTNKYSGNPSMILGNKPQAFSNISPEKGHLASQNDTGQQVRRVTMSVGVETSQVICKTVAVGPSETADPNLSKLPNKLLSANKTHKEQNTTMGKKEMSRRQVPLAKNKVKTAINTAKEKSSIKFVTLYSILSTSLERLKKSSKDGTKHMAPKTSKHVTISGVIAKSRKSIVLQEEKTGKTLGASTHNTVGLVSNEAACVIVKKDFHPSSQPQKSLSEEAVKLQTPSAREKFLETAEAKNLGHPVVAKEPGVTSIISQNTEMQSVSAATLDTKKRKGVPFTAPFDPRFPFTNQTRNCYQNYLDYYRCLKMMKGKSKDMQKCEWYHKVFKSLCPSSWVDQWDEQRKLGTFPGRI